MRVRPGPAVRASRPACLGASPQGFVDDGFDGACAAATFDAATETAINLPGIAREVFGGGDGSAHVVVAKDVAGTDNHENRNIPR